MIQPREAKWNPFFISATPENEIDDEDNYGIPAGYTYLGQFVDHDLTFKADDAFAINGGTAANLGWTGLARGASVAKQGRDG